MNLSARFQRIILGAGLALTFAGLAVPVAGAQQAGIATPGQASIVTDKDTYVVGEPITITYSLPGPGRIRITDHQAGNVSTLRAGYSAQAQGRITGTVTPPAGKECLKLEYTNNWNQRTSAETCFGVKDKEPKKEEPPLAQNPAPGLYTLQNTWSGGMLDSNPQKEVYPHAANGGAFQKWMLETAPDGHFFLRDLATSYYLDSNPAGDVYTLEKNNGQYQQWKFELITREYTGGQVRLFVLRNRATGLLLAVAEGPPNQPDAIRANVPEVPLEASAWHLWQLTAVQP